MMDGKQSRGAEIGSLIGFVVLVLAIAWGAQMLGGDEPGPWYEGLAKPAFNPPGWVFGPVWGLLYMMIAVAGWLVWRRRGRPHAKPALAIYGVQLVLNMLWTGFFFGMQAPLLALIDLGVLWLAIIATYWLFQKVSPLAAWLLIPYWVWVTFAGVLNLSIVVMN